MCPIREDMRNSISCSLICTVERTTAETVPLTFNFLGTKVGRACVGQQTSFVGSALVLSPPSDPQELSHTGNVDVFCHHNNEGPSMDADAK